MKAIILAAGYATRLYPLTLDRPKALLPIGKKPIIDYIVDQILTIPAIDEIFVVTNHKFADHFTQWAEQAGRAIPIRVIDDGTLTEETRKGAIGDIAYVCDEANIDDDVCIIAGDNYFTFSLANYAAYFNAKGCDCVCVKQIPDREEIKSLGVALLDSDGRVLEMEEKPAEPKSDCAVFATYIYRRNTIPLIRQYLQEGNKPDAPGYFVGWLCQKVPVYAFKMDGECYDIGTPAAYEQAQHLVP